MKNDFILLLTLKKYFIIIYLERIFIKNTLTNNYKSLCKHIITNKNIKIN